MHPIIGLIGPSGSGKSTLILETLKKFPELAIMKSFTTRPKRDPEDDLFYEFIDKKTLDDFHQQNRLTHISEYAGNFYTNDKVYLNDLLSKNIAIAALVQSGVQFLRQAGYQVIVINIIPENSDFIREPNRINADKERFKTNLPADFEIINSFTTGGLEKSLEQISNFIQSLNTKTKY